MLMTIFVILLVMWFLGMVTSYTLYGYIHILLYHCDRRAAHPGDSGAEADLRNNRRTSFWISHSGGNYANTRKFHQPWISDSRAGWPEQETPRPPTLRGAMTDSDLQAAVQSRLNANPDLNAAKLDVDAYARKGSWLPFRAPSTGGAA